MSGDVIEWTEPISVRESKREEGRARGIERTRHLGPFTMRWTLWLGAPAFALTLMVGNDIRSLAPIAIGMLCIAISLPAGLRALSRMEGSNLSRWKIDDRGVYCDDGAGFLWEWSAIQAFRIDLHPTVETVATVVFETTHPLEGPIRHKMYFDWREIDQTRMQARFASIGKPAEKSWKRILFGGRRQS